MPERALDVIYKDQGPLEGSPEYITLQKQAGFAYRSLLGELLYAYVTCRPDIGFAVTTMAKFSHHPTLTPITNTLKASLPICDKHKNGVFATKST